MKQRLLTLAALSLLLFTGCADSIDFEAAKTATKVGFMHGFWHGMILPFAWFVSLFDADVAIYAIYNNGGWYDFGFYLGCATSITVYCNKPDRK